MLFCRCDGRLARLIGAVDDLSYAVGYVRRKLDRSTDLDTHGLVVNLHRKWSKLESTIMAAREEFRNAESQMLAALKAELAGRATAIDDAVARAKAAWEADDEAAWKQATQDMAEASAALQAAGAGGGFTPSGNTPTT